jgi:uncharacterized coiled-coil protein SlyX
LNEEHGNKSATSKKLRELEEKITTQEKTIEELERRREMAKKEIKILNYKLEKSKLTQSVNPNSS